MRVTITVQELRELLESQRPRTLAELSDAVTRYAARCDDVELAQLAQMLEKTGRAAWRSLAAHEPTTTTEEAQS